MGLGSSLKKAVKKVTSAAKSVFTPSNIGTALGSVFGGPLGGAAGGALGGMFGGSQNSAQATQPWYSNVWDVLKDVGSSAYNLYKNNQGMISDISSMYGANKAYEQSLEGIRLQNTSAREIADAANLQSQTNAREQMAFQERMSGTAHQREVADLRAAGLNPVLSGTGGMGSSSPAGASGSVVAAPVRSEGDAVSSAFSAFKAMAEAFRANAEREYTQGPRSTLTYAQAQQAGAQTEERQTASELNKARTGEAESRVRNMNQEYENLVELGKNYRAQGALTRAQTAETQQRFLNLKESFKTLKMHGDIDASEFGRIMEITNRAMKNLDYLPDLGKALKSIIGGKK